MKNRIIIDFSDCLYLDSIHNEIKEKLKLEKLPKKIETFDISNISGTNIVARNGSN